MQSELKPCDFCGSSDHLRVVTVGVMTSDMPDCPYRVVCSHIDHDDVQGPVAYGRAEAIAAWNTRASDAEITRLTEALRAAEEREKGWLSDAERYYWLRDHSCPPHNFYISVPVEFAGHPYAPGDVDAYIDAALQALAGAKP